MNIVLRLLSVSLPFLILLPFGLGLWLKTQPDKNDFHYFFYGYLAALVISFYFAVRATRDIVQPLRSLLGRIRNFPRLVENSNASSPVPEIAQVVRSTDDFMERLRAQVTDLTVEKDLLGSLLNGLHEGVICLDREGMIVFQNQGMHSELVEPGAIGKAYFKTIRNVDLLQYIRTSLKREPLHQPGSDPLEFSLPGAHYTALFSPVIFQGMPQLFLVIVHNDTQEFNTRRLREDFLQNASHELKTPITSIRGYAETLLYRTDDPQKAGFLSAVLRNVERMERLIEDMLTISKIESRSFPFQPETLELNGYMRSIAELVNGILRRKEQTLEVKIDPDAGYLFADPLLLEHLLINLLDNASRYSPEHGTVTVHFSNEGKRIRIDVIDQGPGVPKEFREKVFERFFRADRNRSRAEGGSGLGLSIVRQITRIHGGSVAVLDGPVKGARFSVSLPIEPLST
ncbi:MAG: two-component sensor histidine kinase [Spirochaetia bacterium]|nr:two-component sensor histidine kinase [Spirochaetia bacterium]